MKHVTKLFIPFLAVLLLFTACKKEPAAETHTCTVTVTCADVLANPDTVDSELLEILPEDGFLLPETEVTFSEGENAFDVLQRACKDAELHMEFVETPAYNSVYIQGIGNLYEQDAGEMSGWLYEVNGASPDVGCNQYELQDGDAVTFTYICNMMAAFEDAA